MPKKFFLGVREGVQGRMREMRKMREMGAYFSRDLENLSPNLSPSRREALNSPPSVQQKLSHPLSSPVQQKLSHPLSSPMQQKLSHPLSSPIL
jgi:hypothetical protein